MSYYRSRLNEKLARIEDYPREMINDRVEYYCKGSDSFELSPAAAKLKELSRFNKSAYYNDYYSMLRYFPEDVRTDHLFRDNRAIPEIPTIVKSRELCVSNQNAILLKLNSVRHFLPIEDQIPFGKKHNKLVWRGAVWKERRKEFMRKYAGHPLCDVGQVNKPTADTPPEWVKSKLSIRQQLKYKFILSIEGNDVATNLKWIAQSNSLCFMKKPTCETWMMEGRLQAGVHYVELENDYKDLSEKLNYYTDHTDEALEIISNFNTFYRQFQDPILDELLQLMVIQKYLTLSGQITE